MVLDSEIQRNQLREILQQIPLQGSFAEMKQYVSVIDGLVMAVETATIKNEEEGDKENEKTN